MATAVVQPDVNVTGFVSKIRKLLINGKWVDAASGWRRGAFCRSLTARRDLFRPDGF